MFGKFFLFRRPAKPAKPRRYRPQLEVLEDRTVPALITTGGTLWFYQNLRADTAFMKEALTLWQQDHNSFQYNDMVKLFQFVANEHSTVTQTDLSLLQNLISHAYSAGWMPQYVENLSSNVVNYNLSNEYFQFRLGSNGKPTSGSTLLPSGQLAAGNPSSDLLTLVDKWFLGMDHPDMAVNKVSGQTVEALGWSDSTYVTASGALWGNTGPSYMDISQGGAAGDCYFLSSLGAVVSQDAQAIEKMFINNGNGTYTVRFYVANSNGTFTPQYVTVDTMLPFTGVDQYNGGSPTSNWYFQYANGGAAPVHPTTGGNTQYAEQGNYWLLTNQNNNPGNHLWVALLEKAFAQFNSELAISATPIGGDYTSGAGQIAPQIPAGTNSYYVIGEGGAPGSALPEILGTAANGIDFSSVTQQELINLVNAHDAVTLVSKSATPTYGHRRLVDEDHIYYVIAYNPTTQLFTVVNPWAYNFMGTSADSANENIFGMANEPFSFLTSNYGYLASAPV